MASNGSLSRLVSKVGAALRDTSPSGRRSRRSRGDSMPTGSTDVDHRETGGVEVAYAPARDGDADPGEVVWTWVPYEDDPTQGKDRPVLVIGYQDGELAGVQLSSKDHADRRDAGEWVGVGTGAWDREGRPSYADASRLLRVDPGAVRREGAALDQDRFDAVLARVRHLHGWSG